MEFRRHSGLVQSLLLITVFFMWIGDSCAEVKNLDVVLLMDSSGSMKHTDPHTLRAPAAKLFVSLLGKTDRASIVSFSDTGYPVAYLTPVTNNRNKRKLFAAIDKISTKGVYTNLSGAIDGALRVFKRNAHDKDAEPRRRMIVLMSDGKMDVGNDKKSQRLQEKLLQQQIPELTNQGIVLNTIAFTKRSDQALLKQIAVKSGGRYYLAKTDKSLRGVYTSIFEQSKAPNQIPFKGDSFMIDSSVTESTIIGSKKSPNSKLTLISPNGKRYTQTTRTKSINWFVSGQYDLITVKKPLAGKWQLQSSDGDDKAYVVSDLQLYLEHSPEHPTIGEGVFIKAWLQSGDKKIAKHEIIDDLKVKMTVLTPEGKTHHLEMERFSKYEDKPGNEGVYASHIAFPTAGRFNATAEFNGSTFAREKTILIDIAAPIPTTDLASSPIEKSTPAHTVSAAHEKTKDQHDKPTSAHTKKDVKKVHEKPHAEKTPAMAQHDTPEAARHEEAPRETITTGEIQLPPLPNFGAALPGNTKTVTAPKPAAAKSEARHEKPHTAALKHEDSGKKPHSHAKKDPSSTQEKNPPHEEKQPAATHEDGGINWALIAFAGLNSLLIMGGIAAYIVYRSRTQTGADSDELETDDADAEQIDLSQDNVEHPDDNEQEAA